MTEKRKVLGRGLETLLPPRQHPFMPLIPGGGSVTPGETVQELALAQLDPNPYQTRSDHGRGGAGGTARIHCRDGRD